MAKPKLPIPVTLLTGYLGSGKTTLINHVPAIRRATNVPLS